MRASTVLALVLALALPACSMLGMGDGNRLHVVEYGVYKNGRHVMTTNGVHRELGASFGFRFTLKDAKGGSAKARITTLTPGLIDPAGQKVLTEFVTETTIQAGQVYDVFFTFSKPWEMVSGHWELKVETDKGDRVSHVFDVFNPSL
jgi:hypothetical protein